MAYAVVNCPTAPMLTRNVRETSGRIPATTKLSVPRANIPRAKINKRRSIAASNRTIRWMSGSDRHSDKKRANTASIHTDAHYVHHMNLIEAWNTSRRVNRENEWLLRFKKII